jgi:hypothetical protein
MGCKRKPNRKKKKIKIVGSRLMSWTKPRRKHVERGETEKEFRPNDQESVDKTAVEMLSRGGGRRLTKTGK